jgi:molybdate transport system regulatory protein
VVDAQSGGRHGGGARLTPFGHDLVRRYRALERDAARAVDCQVDAIAAALAPQDSR